MSGGWSKQRDVARLADSRAEFEFAVPAGELQELHNELSAAGEPLRARLQFGREQGLPVAEVALRGRVGLICQRCLQAMTLQVDAIARLAVVASEAEAERVPGELETFLAPEGQVSCQALAMEELLLALPVAPRHAAGEPCSAATPTQVPAEDVTSGAAVETESQETQRPFADLRDLMNRDRR